MVRNEEGMVKNLTHTLHAIIYFSTPLIEGPGSASDACGAINLRMRLISNKMLVRNVWTPMEARPDTIKSESRA